MYERFLEHIDQIIPSIKNSKLLIAVSGGLDSMVLWQLIRESGFDHGVAHCNFSLRGEESDQDELFVKDYAKRFGISVHSKRFDTKKEATTRGISTQMAARDLRYAWFDQLLTVKDYDVLLTAHHLDDQLETFLINLSRGSGLKGLQGIPSENEKIKRPLLPFSRKELETYAKEKHVAFRHDSSNDSSDYLRNAFRNSVIPKLIEVEPEFLNSFSKSIDYLQQSSDIIDDRIKELESRIVEEGDGHIRFKVDELIKLEANHGYYFSLFSRYGFKEPGEISQLLKAQSGKFLVSDQFRLIKDRDHLILTPKSAMIVDDIKLKTDNGSFRLADRQLNWNTEPLTSNKPLDLSDKNTAYIDHGALVFPLTVRKWKNGDYFYPLGMKGKKKLSDYFVDQKFSLYDKENIWLLCSGESIVWLIGDRLDERYKLRANTNKLLKVTLT